MSRLSRRVGDTITLVDGFSVCRVLGPGKPVTVPTLPVPSRRVLAFLAIEGAPRARQHVAFTLWPNVGEGQASQSLRTALSGVQALLPGIIDVNTGLLALTAGVQVDLNGLRSTALDLRHVGDVATMERLIGRFAADLLPDWYDEWLVCPRDRWREVRLHALDLLSERLLRQGEHASAIDAAVASISIEPLRETGRRGLVNAFLHEGNVAQAVREFVVFRTLLQRELGIEPSAQLRALVYDAPGAAA